LDENLARQAELAFERQGDYDTLCYEGAWLTSGQMADRGSGSRPGWPAWACGPATGCWC
jgi:long-chain acyl-CoA synthetase